MNALPKRPLPPSKNTPTYPTFQAQTPQQRRANEKFAKNEAAKRGKPEAQIKKKNTKFEPPISKVWVGESALLFP